MQEINLYVPQTMKTWHDPVVLENFKPNSSTLSSVALDILKKYVEEAAVNLKFSAVRFTYYLKKGRMIGILAHLDRVHRVFCKFCHLSKFKADYIINVYIDLEKRNFEMTWTVPNEQTVFQKKALFKRIEAAWEEQMHNTANNLLTILHTNFSNIKVNQAALLASWEEQKSIFFLIALMFTEKYLRPNQ